MVLPLLIITTFELLRYLVLDLAAHLFLLTVLQVSSPIVLHIFKLQNLLIVPSFKYLLLLTVTMQIFPSSCKTI